MSKNTKPTSVKDPASSFIFDVNTNMLWCVSIKRQVEQQKYPLREQRQELVRHEASKRT